MPWIVFANSARLVARGCARVIGGEWYASGESDFSPGTVVGVSGVVGGVLCFRSGRG